MKAKRKVAGPRESARLLDQHPYQSQAVRPRPGPSETVVADGQWVLENTPEPEPKKRQSLIGEYVVYKYLNGPVKIGKLKTTGVGRVAIIVPWDRVNHAWSPADTVYQKDIIGPATEQQLKDCGLFEVNQ